MLGSIIKALVEALLGSGLEYLKQRRQEAALRNLGHGEAVEAARMQQDALHEKLAQLQRLSPDDVNRRLHGGTF